MRAALTAALVGAAYLAGLITEHCRPAGTRWCRTQMLYLSGLICPRADCSAHQVKENNR